MIFQEKKAGDFFPLEICGGPGAGGANFSFLVFFFGIFGHFSDILSCPDNPYP